MGSVFEQFINKNQHEIYHLHNSSRCCQCPNGYNPPRTSRILYVQQMDLLFDRTSKLSCHKSGRSGDYCCSTARPGLHTDILDLTLARCLLVNFCLDVFWYSCLNQQGMTLEDFLNNHKHDIYHLWQYNTPCCQCLVSGYSFPSSRPILDQTNWIQMFNALKLPCLNHKKRPSPGSMHSICSVASMSGITVTQLDPYVSKVIFQHFCSLRRAIEKLVQIRNEDFGHATTGEMTDTEFKKSVINIENCILEIARFCNKEKHFQAKLEEAKHGTLQYMLYEKYKNCLTEYVAHQDEMNKGLAEILPKLDKLGGKIASKAERLPAVIAAKVPKIMEETVQQFQETLDQSCTDHGQLLNKVSSYFNKLKYQTDLEIRCHWSEGTFVETNAVRKCIKKNEKYDVLIIFGSEGMGKSRIGLEILRRLGEKDSLYDLVKISDPKKVQKVIIDNGKLALCLEEVFSSTFVHSENVISNHIFDLLHARKSTGNTKIIFTVQSLQRKLFNNVFASHRLFQCCYEIDLNKSKFSMTEAEKEDLLTKFCTKQKIKVDWSIDNDTDDTILNKRTFYQIARTEPYIGYPKACFLFSTKKGAFQLGLRFFTHAHKNLIEKIISLRDGSHVQDTISYATLVYLLLNGNCISINEIDVQKVTAIMTLCGNIERCALKHLIVKGLQNMEGKYVLYDQLDFKYQFSHHVVSEAVAISYFDVDPSSVISVLTLNFISDIIRIQSKDLKEKEEPSLILPQYLYSNLAKQLFKILLRDFRTCPFEFVKLLCETKLLQQDDANFVNCLLKECEMCTIDGELELKYQKMSVKVSFHFPSALLHFMSGKDRVYNTMAAVIDSLEGVVKTKENIKIYNTCSNILLATFSCLMKRDEVDIIFRQILEIIEEHDIGCDFNTFIHSAIERGKCSTCSFVLKRLSHKIDIMELVMSVADTNLSKFHSIACDSFNIAISSCTDRVEIAKRLLKKTPKDTFDLNSVLLSAISYKIESVLIWLLGTFQNLKFDTNVIINSAYKHGWNEVLILLLDMDICNMKSVNLILSEACIRGCLIIVKNALTNVDHTVFDMKTAMKKTCDYDHPDIVKYLIENVDLTLFDMKTLVNTAFHYRWLVQVKYPNENVEHKLFHTTNMKSASNYEWLDIVKYLISNVDHALFDMKTLMDSACKKKDLDIVKCLVENVDHTLFDMKTVMYSACKEKDLDIVKCLIENVGHTQDNIKPVMDAACNEKDLNMVKCLIENIDHALIDMRTLMNTARQHEQFDIVKYLIENADHTLFDMKTVINAAIVFGSLDIVKYVIGNVDRTLFDMKVLLNEACELARLHIVKYLIENVDHTLYDMKTAMNEACQNGGSNIVEYLIENVDHTLFDMKTAMNEVCQNGSLNIVEYLIENVDHTLFDMKTAMNEVCLCGSLDIVKYLMKNVDHTLFDMVTAMNEASQYGSLDIVKYLMKNFDFSLFDIEAAMNEACGEAHFDIMKYMMKNCNHALFDMHTVMHTACKKDELVFFKYLMENVDHTLFDMKTAMNEACQYGSLDIIKYLIENFDFTLFDIETAMNVACEDEHFDIMKYMMENCNHALFDMHTVMHTACKEDELVFFKYLMDNVDHTLFDMKTAMNEACLYASFYIVKYLIENVDHTLFDMKTAMNEVGVCGSLDIVKYLMKNVDHTLFDMETAMNEACQYGSLDMIKYLIENFDFTLFDIEAAMNEACGDEHFDIMKYLMENFNHALFDMDTVMHTACKEDELGFFKYLIDNVDHTLFDMKTAMNKACMYGSLGIVKYLIENFDHTLFDIKTAMITVCRSSGKDAISILQWLWENVNRDLFDMDVAMNNACAYGRTETVEWLWMNTNTKTYHIQNALLKACEIDHVSTVDWLIINVPEHLLDLQHALQTVCSSSKCTSANTVQVLAKHADKSKLNIDSLIETACKCCKTNIVRYLTTCTQINTIDFKKALNTVLSIDINQGQNNKYVNEGKQDLVLFLLQKADPSNMNIESAIIEACKHDWVDIIKHIWLNISHKYFEISAVKIKIACAYGSLGIIQWSLCAIPFGCVDLNTLMIESCGYGWLNIVKRVWNHEHINHEKLDMKTAMNDACTYNRLEIVTWLLQNIDGQTFDMSYVLMESCRNGWIDIVKTVTQNGDATLYNMTPCITQACTNSHLEVIEYMYTAHGTNHFDLKNIFECKSKESENEGVTMFLIRNFNIDSVHIPTIVTKAFSLGWTEVVKWIIEELKYNGDLADPLNNACENGEAEIVKYILENVSQEKLDLKSAMLSACNKGWDEIVTLLLQNVDHQKLKVRNAVIEACRCEDSDCAILIIRLVDHTLIDLNDVLIELCKHSTREKLVLSILKTVDSSEFDQNIVMETAKKHNWRTILLFLNRQKS